MTAAVPGGGERVASRNQVFTRGPFGGTPPPMADTKDAKGAAQRLLNRLAPERPKVLMVLVLITGSVALNVYGPKLLGKATDVIVKGLFAGNGVPWDDLRPVLFHALLVYLGGSALAWLSSYTMAGVVQRTMRRLRADVEDKINRLPLSYVDKTPRGDLLSRVTNDIDNVGQSLQMSVTQVLNAVLTVLGVVLMMMLISAPLALFAMLLVPLSVVVVRTVGQRSRTRFSAQWRHTGELNAQVEESFTGHTLVKVFGRQRVAEEQFAETNEELYQASYRAQFVVGVMQPVMMFLGNLNYVVVGVLGGLRITSGAMSIGDVQAFIQYSRQFTQPLTTLAGMMNMLQSGLASAERVFELLDAPEQSEDPAAVPALGAVEGRVEFAGVSFSYDPDRALIQELSLVAEPGRTVAIVGPTGAGKTTLVNLLMRFYEIDGGAITLDGIDIRTLRRDQLRSQLGMVLQDTWLFEGTIRENIRYGNIEATDEQVLEAARAAYVDRFVHSLPDGYETVVDEDGGNLSTGEKQLLTIARAFLSDPAILILDEATSSVDTRTEVLVQHAMAALRSRRTSFVIAHRLSTVRDADLILMMKAGRIVEQGTHEELLAARGAYFELYDSQFRAPAADLDEEAAAQGAPVPAGSGGPPGRGGPRPGGW
jgi:ATP-binding cassette subfamily B protein